MAAISRSGLTEDQKKPYKNLFMHCNDSDLNPQLVRECLKTLGVSALPSRPKTAGTPRPLSAGKRGARPVTPGQGKMTEITTYFRNAFSGSAEVGIPERHAVLRDLFDRLGGSVFEIAESAKSYVETGLRRQWKAGWHSEIGYALLCSFQQTFGPHWDANQKIKKAWAAAYVHLQKNALAHARTLSFDFGLEKPQFTHGPLTARGTTSRPHSAMGGPRPTFPSQNPNAEIFTRNYEGPTFSFQLPASSAPPASVTSLPIPPAETEDQTNSASSTPPLNASSPPQKNAVYIVPPASKNSFCPCTIL